VVAEKSEQIPSHALLPTGFLVCLMRYAFIPCSCGGCCVYRLMGTPDARGRHRRILDKWSFSTSCQTLSFLPCYSVSAAKVIAAAVDARP
jgi:hypothetical protein